MITPEQYTNFILRILNGCVLETHFNAVYSFAKHAATKLYQTEYLTPQNAATWRKTIETIISYEQRKQDNTANL